MRGEAGCGLMSGPGVILQGGVKFRDGKKWKTRWCVVRRLSPAADFVELQLYSTSCGSGGAAKASLALQHFLGFESGFTLDKESHTLALLCCDLVAVVAFETRERLIRWQVKLATQLGEPHRFLVLVAEARRLPAGPARLHLSGRRFALATGTPPRLLGVWELAHLRRYGVVEGRFCFEGGALCGTGEGLHVLLADRPTDLADAFDRAAGAASDALEHAIGGGGFTPHLCIDDDLVAILPRARAKKKINVDSSFEEESETTVKVWSVASHARSAYELNSKVTRCGVVGLPRCWSCVSELGAPAGSSTAPRTPLSPVTPPPLGPVWSMSASRDRPPPGSSLDTDRRELSKSLKRIGPYANYDVPKWKSEVECRDKSKKCNESIQVTASEEMTSFRQIHGPEIAKIQPKNELPSNCACDLVTRWASNIRLPYCKPRSRPPIDIYATVDVAQKLRSRSEREKDFLTSSSTRTKRRTSSSGSRPFASYENLHSSRLRHYENIGDNEWATAPKHYEHRTACPACGQNVKDKAQSILEKIDVSDHYVPMRPAPSKAAPNTSPDVLSENPARKKHHKIAAYRNNSHDHINRKRSRSAESCRFLECLEESDGSDVSSFVETTEKEWAQKSTVRPSGGEPGGADRPAFGSADRPAFGSADSGLSSCSPRLSDPGAQLSPPPAETENVIRKEGATTACAAADARSTSSGASDMSDYMETLSLSSSHSSGEAQCGPKRSSSTLRPRSGGEYCERAARAHGRLAALVHLEHDPHK